MVVQCPWIGKAQELDMENCSSQKREELSLEKQAWKTSIKVRDSGPQYFGGHTL